MALKVSRVLMISSSSVRKTGLAASVQVLA
jgi:hypothetical protein